MQLAEVGKLLAIIRSFDNRKLEESTAMAWKLMLDREVPEARLEDAQDVVMDWFATANPYFEVRHLCDGLKKKMRISKFSIEGDVRSAKARGLIAKDWPDRKALPWPVRDELARVRQRERVEAAELGAFDDAPNVSPLSLDTGRRV